VDGAREVAQRFLREVAVELQRAVVAQTRDASAIHCQPPLVPHCRLIEVVHERKPIVSVCARALIRFFGEEPTITSSGIRVLFADAENVDLSIDLEASAALQRGGEAAQDRRLQLRVRTE